MVASKEVQGGHPDAQTNIEYCLQQKAIQRLVKNCLTMEGKAKIIHMRKQVNYRQQLFLCDQKSTHTTFDFLFWELP